MTSPECDWFIIHTTADAVDHTMQTIRLRDIQNDKALCDWWAAITNTPEFGKIWKMMNDTHPLRFVDPSMPVTTPSSDKRLGVLEGYEIALSRLMAAATHVPAMASLPDPTFEPMIPVMDGPNPIS